MVPSVSIGETRGVKATDSKTWSPDFRHIYKGDKIVWKNPTGARHRVKSYGGDWRKNALLEPGQRTSKVFKKTGPYTYRCRIHSRLSDGECTGMCGSIHVAAKE
jgi:plastocyanin